MKKATTIDFHVTSDCSQDCPYCWGPLDFEKPVDTEEAKRILRKIHSFGIRRVVFTGGDPLQRSDIGELISFSKRLGLEVALSTTGDKLTEEFLEARGKDIDLISLPLDGSCEAVSILTKKEGHFASIMRDLDLLKNYPEIDVKVATAVTRKNIHDIGNIAGLVDEWASRVKNRVFYNIFQTFQRSMRERNWKELLVPDEEFEALKNELQSAFRIKINFLPRRTLDRLYVLIFPDGGLYVPSGPNYEYLGKFLGIEDLEEALKRSNFDSPKHVVHSKGWEKGRKAAHRSAKSYS